MEIRRLSWGECVLVEDQLRPLIQRVIDEDPVQVYSADAILNDLFEALSQAWIIVEEDDIVGIVGTQIQQLPLARVLVIDMAASTEESSIPWKEVLAELKQFGKENDCTIMRILGRKGWERVLKDCGFYHPGIVLWGDIE